MKEVAADCWSATRRGEQAHVEKGAAAGRRARHQRGEHSECADVAGGYIDDRSLHLAWTGDVIADGPHQPDAA
jgi:hypothetical protein